MNTCSFVEMNWFVSDGIPLAHVGMDVAVASSSKRGECSLFALETIGKVKFKHGLSHGILESSQRAPRES